MWLGLVVLLGTVFLISILGENDMLVLLWIPVILGAIGGFMYFLAVSELWGPFIAICVIIGVIILCTISYLLNKLVKKWEKDTRIRNEIEEKERKDEEERIKREAELEKKEEEDRRYEKFHHYENMINKSMPSPSYCEIDQGSNCLQFINHPTDDNKEMHVPRGQYIARLLQAEMEYFTEFINNNPLKDGYPNFRKRLEKYCVIGDRLYYDWKVSNDYNNYGYSGSHVNLTQSLLSNPEFCDSQVFKLSADIFKVLSKYDQAPFYVIAERNIQFIKDFAIKLDNAAKGQSIEGMDNDIKFCSMLKDIIYFIRFHNEYLRPILTDYLAKVDYLFEHSNYFEQPLAIRDLNKFHDVRQLLSELGIKN